MFLNFISANRLTQGYDNLPNDNIIGELLGPFRKFASYPAQRCIGNTQI